MRSDVGLCDKRLILISTKELNKLLKKNNIPKARQKIIKQERRTLKNRYHLLSSRPNHAVVVTYYLPTF